MSKLLYKLFEEYNDIDEQQKELKAQVLHDH